MQAYNELLNQFHSQQASIIQQDNRLKYTELLNSLRLSRQKKQQTKQKLQFQFSRKKQVNQSMIKTSTEWKKRQTTKLDEVNQSFRSKRTLIQLQKQSLQEQINQIHQAFSKLRQQKQVMQQQIKLIDSNHLQIQNALQQSLNNLEQLQYSIKQQKTNNQKQFILYDQKIQQLTLKLQQLNEENVLNSKYYKQLITTKTEWRNNSFLGGILFWQAEENKIRKLPKKIFTKSHIQQMLRTLFVLNRLEKVNYGNIIEHLIVLSEGDNSDKMKMPKPKVYTNEKGEEIEIRQVIKILQSQLLSQSEFKFLSKEKTFQFYHCKGVIIQPSSQSSSLSSQTFQLAKNIVILFQRLTSWFSRIQKRNSQLSQSYRQLQITDQQLTKKLKLIEHSAAQKSINYLQSRQHQLQELHDRLNSSSKIIFQFNINMHDLIKRFQNLNKFFDKIVKSTNKRTYKKTYIEIEEDTIFLKKITKILFKSPQCIILDWNNVINSSKKDVMSKSTQNFELLPQNQVYFHTIMKNDLLRIYAQPQKFDSHKSFIQNFQATFNYVINDESDIIQKLSNILKDLLLFSKNGIFQFENLKRQRIEQEKRLQEKRKKSAMLNDKETNDKLSPLLKLFQKSELKVDTFFVRDQINENDKLNQQGDQEGLCVESNDYYRRDNFKLIQKLQKLNLKKKGLLASVPFTVNTSLQLQPLSYTIDNISTDKQTTRINSTRKSLRRLQPRLSHQLLSTRHNMLSERREKQSTRQKSLKQLLKNISNIATDNQKYRIRKKLNSQQNSMYSSFCTNTPKSFCNTSKLC